MFRAPQSRILRFLHESNHPKYASKTGLVCNNDVYPLKLVVLALNNKNQMCYQKVIVNNEQQKIFLLDLVLPIANVIYECDFMNTKKEAESDLIVSFSQLKCLEKK